MGLAKRLVIKNPLVAGALIGALAALLMAGAGHLKLAWSSRGPWMESTGATQGMDLWTYFSMARAVWRSPNGITYSYPYDLYWPTEAVVFQLPITVLAWVGRITGLPAAFEIGRVAGGAGAGAALAAIGLMFPSGFWRRWFYVAAALGGGLFILGAVGFSYKVAGLDGLTELFHYQPHAEGKLFWWLPFPVRNLRLPLECIYHALVMGALACLVWRRYGWAWLLGLIIWVSNPFSAVALHSAVLPWLVWRCWEVRGRRRQFFGIQLGAWLAVNGLAALYYGWFLNQWPALRNLHELYRSAHNPALEWWRVILLVLPFGAGLAASFFHRDLRRAVWGCPRFRLFGLLAVVHIALMQQSLVLGERSMQAFHYNRGYLHLALVVVFWRVLVVFLRKRKLIASSMASPVWWPKHLPSIRQKRWGRVIVAVVLFSTFDNVLFFVYAADRFSIEGAVASDYAAMARSIPGSPAPMLVLTEAIGMPGSYITAFTPHIAWHAVETMVVPFYAERAHLLDEALKGKLGGVAALGIDYAIMYRDNKEHTTALERQGWTRATESETIILYRAPRPVAEQNPQFKHAEDIGDQ